MDDWIKEFPGAVTVSDASNRILYMNDKAARVFEGDGGQSLVGGDLLACHNPRSKAIIEGILVTGEPHVYTIEKKGVHKFIYQAPWRRDGAIAGLVELSMEIPAELPHFKRDKA